MAYTVTDSDCRKIERAVRARAWKMRIPNRYHDDMVQDVFLRTLVWAQGHDVSVSPFLGRVFKFLDYLIWQTIRGRTKSYRKSSIRVSYVDEMSWVAGEKNNCTQVEVIDTLNRVLPLLSSRQRRVMRLWSSGMTTTSIGAAIGVTRQRAHQIIQESQERVYVRLGGAVV